MKKEQLKPESIKAMFKTVKGFMRIIVSDEISYTQLDAIHDYAIKEFGKGNYSARRQYKNEVLIYPNKLNR